MRDARAMSFSTHDDGNLLEAAFLHAAVGMAVADLEGRFVRTYPALERMLDIGSDRLVGALVEDVIPATDPEEDSSLMEELLAGTLDSYRLEKYYRRKDGGKIWVRVTVSLLRDAEGCPNGSMRVIEDVTDRKNFERSVEQLSREYEVILNTAGWGIVGTDHDGKITFSNPSAARMLDFEVEELLGYAVRDIHHSAPEGTSYGEGECSICHAMHDGFPRQGRNDVLWRRDGTSFPVEFTIAPILEEGQVQGVVLAFMDITEQLRIKRELHERIHELTELNQRFEIMQTQLLQSAKLAGIGQLAAGVAHEINNPVGFVSSNLYTLEKYLRDLLGVAAAYAAAEQICDGAGMGAAFDEVRRLKKCVDFDYLSQDASDLIAESTDGLTRVKRIVQDLKDFSHVDASDEWVWADLHRGLDSTLNIVSNDLKYKCEVKKEYGALPDIYCLPSQINQVFINLLVNAGHAIEESGTITLRSGHEGEQVWIEIGDTGRGIAPEHLQWIFDPFFTTKPIGKGTGLGLSLAYGIVQKHHGRIEVQSEVGKGAAFKVWLPIRGPEEAA